MTTNEGLDKTKLSLKSLYDLAAKSVPVGSDQVKVHEDFNQVARFLIAHNSLTLNDVAEVWKGIRHCRVFYFDSKIVVKVANTEIVRLSIEKDICDLPSVIEIDVLRAICVTLKFLEEQKENWNGTL